MNTYILLSLNTYSKQLFGDHFPNEIIRLIMVIYYELYSCRGHRLLEITASHTRALKEVFRIINEILQECCIQIIPQKGLRITKRTEDKKILIILNLDMVRFETFYCGGLKFSLGIDVNKFYHLLCLMDDDAPVTLYMNHDDDRILHISSDTKHQYIDIINIIESEINIPRIQFQNKISIECFELNSICKKMYNELLEYADITINNNEITLNDIVLGNNNNGNPINKNNFNQGKFELQDLILFSKCDRLCRVINMYFKENYPLLLEINVNNLGKLYVFIQPESLEI